MTTITWAGHSGSWSFPTFWRPLVVPGSLDTALFGALDSSTATIGAASSITSVTLAAGSHATVQVQNTLTVTGSFTANGGTVELDQGGTLAGGTIDLNGGSIVANGGVIDGSVWIGDLGRGILVTAATLTLTQAARPAGSLAVVGALGLVGGSYEAITLSLSGFGTTSGTELDVTNGDVVLFDTTARIVLTQDDPAHTPGTAPSGAPPVLGGSGTIGNQGVIISDALTATISATAFLNAGSIALNNASVLGMSEFFLSTGLLSWDALLAPALLLQNTQFENDGTITGQGATLDVSGGGFVNTGLIDLGQATTQGPILLPLPHIGTQTLTSTLEIGADVSGFSNTGTLAAGTIQLDGNVSLSSLGTLLGTVVFNGTLDLGGGTLDAGTLAATTVYIVKGTVANGTILNANGQINTQAATLDQVEIFVTQPTTLSDVLGPGTVVLSDSTTELAYTTAATVSGLTVDAGIPGQLARIGVKAGSVTFGADTLITDTVAGSSVAIGGGGVFIENGRVQLAGSNLDIAALDGTGTLTLTDNAVLTIASIAATASLTVVFGAGTSALILPGDASGLGALGITILGLQAGDLLDFVGVSASPGTVFAEPGAVVTDGTLQVQGASGDQASLNVSSIGSGLTFNAATDANGGTLVTVACFRCGTRIATPNGERRVEALRIGDPILTRDGRTRPVKWLGHRAYPAALVRRQPQLRPVRLAAHALGPGRPRRRLDLSPLHAVLINGVLVPAAALVDGRTVTRAPIADTAYIHIELDTPDIILANGAEAETFVDCDNRDMFDNAAEFHRLYPTHTAARWTFPVPRVEEGWQLQAILDGRRGGAAVASRPGPLQGHIDTLIPNWIEGWVMDSDHPTDPIELELVAGGRKLGCLIANRYRIDLDRAGKGRGTCGFTAALPDLDPASLASLALIRLTDGAVLTA